MTPLVIDQQLALVPLTMSHAKPLHKIILASKHSLSRFLYWADAIETLSDTEAYIKQRINSELPGAHWFVILAANEVIGVFGIKSIDDQGVAELGYWLTTELRGEKIINRIIAGIAKTFLKECAARSVKIHCLSENLASQKVAINCGAQLVGCQREFITLDGVLQDLLEFHLTLEHMVS